MKSFLAALGAIVVTTGFVFAAADAPGGNPTQYLGLLRLTARYQAEANWDDAARNAVGSHFRRLQEHAKTGKVILAGRTQEPNDKTMGLVIFEAKDLAEAERFMAEDPAVQAGVMVAEVRPYQVAVMRK